MNQQQIQERLNQIDASARDLKSSELRLAALNEYRELSKRLESLKEGEKQAAFYRHSNGHMAGRVYRS